MRKRVAIMGANSHIARGLIVNFLKAGGFHLNLFTTSPDKTRAFFKTTGRTVAGNCSIHKGYQDFLKTEQEVIVNCVGVGTLRKLENDFTRYFMVTEKYDNLAIEYLQRKRPDALYVTLSSGAVYGGGFMAPVGRDSVNRIRVNHLMPDDFYAVARLNAETKHRAFAALRIVDLRVFSYFSRFIDLDDGYFIADVLNCLLRGETLETDNTNIVRDYIHPDDLFALIQLCMTARRINVAFDAVSAGPVSKMEILGFFKSEYGLRFRINQGMRQAGATGRKNVYFSRYNRAEEIGYSPRHTSMDTIRLETKEMMRLRNIEPVTIERGSSSKPGT